HGDGTATITASPSLSDRGNFVITVLASDNGNGNPNNVLTGSAQFVLSAIADNVAPKLSPIGGKVAIVGQELVFNVVAADGDQDPLTFSTQGLPPGATLTPTGIYGVAEFRWTPTQTGVFDITFTVTDSGNG